eukprot:CAMPEP_0197855584 /NCGR_PEP_ID=MMETSP1438-20131217/26906_1 /TAXON_ID=1461541 /ORGANISM="Pterosperma sp., Strain CCMP1384" /LENGTH=465 /DNA_ID=CAMNT_0043470757 /DNA_START=308 /DNA_END=1705 /DNA_ORIENTATION=+
MAEVAITATVDFFSDGHVVLETVLIATIIYLVFQKSYKPEKEKPLSETEVDQLCADWEPEPLTPQLTEGQNNYQLPVLTGPPTAHTTVDGKQVLNLVSSNFLDLASHPTVKEACAQTLEKYGCGSCGPRGFYGTIDIHLQLEEDLARFMGTEGAILYSFGLVTAASTIPAFVKRGDIVICDDGCSWSIQNGCFLSRSTLKVFKHNDMEDLERILKEVIAEYEKTPRHRRKLNRRFIVTEGLFANYGDMCPLPKLLELKNKYSFRLMVDDSMGIGTVGARGVADYYGIEPKEIDLITASMGNALGSIGGFCAGDNESVEHQRLSGAGYVFSASLPPYLSTASRTTLALLQEHPETLDKLQTNAAHMRKALKEIKGIVLDGPEVSPLMHLRLTPSGASHDQDTALLDRVVARVMKEGKILISTAKYSVGEAKVPAPSLRITVTSGHNKEDLTKAAVLIGKCLAKERK